MHKDNFAPRVNFARVTFLHESEKKQKKTKNYLIKKIQNKLLLLKLIFRKSYRGLGVTVIVKKIKK